LIHRKYRHHWDELVGRVGLQQAQELWDHLAQDPANPPPTAATCFLKGKAGKPRAEGWSRTVHYEVTSKARVNYQYCDRFFTTPEADPHPIVAILTIDYSSH